MTEKVTEARISTGTHGRYLVRSAAGRPRGLLVGFHGYAETAEHAMRALQEIPGSEAWLIGSLQALHLFYRGRTDQVVASWMTRVLREEAILDNLRYVESVIEKLRLSVEPTTPVVVAGFSQGASMAYRTALLGKQRIDGVIALGGDIPPEIDRTAGPGRPEVLIGQGSEDEWYTDSLARRDREKLEALRLPFEVCRFRGGHEWSPVFLERCGEFLEGVLAGVP